MFKEFFISLTLAHFVADFVMQTDSLSRQKRERKASSWFMYVHAATVALLSIIMVWDFRMWPVALIIGGSHLLIDLGKSFIAKESTFVFIADQILHIIIILAMWQLCKSRLCWQVPVWLTQEVLKAEMVAIAVILCNKPSNILIKGILESHKVVPLKSGKEDLSEEKLLHAGKMIGTLERWLILVFLLIGKYEVIGFLIAAKSIIRFGEQDKSRTEYFIAGTLLSIFMAIVIGFGTRWVLASC